MNSQESIGMVLILILFIHFWKLLYSKRPNQAIPTEDSTSNTESLADSPATTSSSVGGDYEVFLSFRGEDTRTGFTDYLYTSLDGAGVRTFQDDNKLRIGEDIGPELIKAIKESKVLIPILSINYAARKWCMIELAQMVECHTTEGKMIFPIFYDVVPSDARNQKGNYEKAFRQHEKKFGIVTVQKWKDAMTMVGELKGLELKKATNGHEGELVKMVVKEVMLVLKKNYTSLPPNLVRMDHHIGEMETLLDINCDVTRIVGILGMGGIGKTTISRVVFNRLCDSFVGSCFLNDVRERSKHHKGFVSLQSELVSKITRQELITISNVDHGTRIIKDMLHKKKVLIVLDDVDAISQVNHLIGDCLIFCQGSKIIITTRNKDVLDIIEETCRIERLLDYKCYEPPLMNDNHSFTLFCKYAFKQESPPQEYAILSKDVVSNASGLPLVLVTIGSLLFGVKDQTIWEEKVKKLKKIPNKEVLEKLRISFDALGHEEQQIFLDIACLGFRRDKRYASYMWDICGYLPKSGLDTLVRRSLIRVGDDNHLRMHDQLIDLGKQIVRQENLIEVGKRSRVWDLEEVSDVLKRGLGTYKLEALSIWNNEYDTPRICFVRRDFLQLQNLRYLVLEFVERDGDFTDLFPKLRFLTWISRGEIPPTNISLKNLVFLELDFGALITSRRKGWSLFEAGITQARNLKGLVLMGCNNIEILTLSAFEDLEILIIENCNSLWKVAGMSLTKRLKEVTFDCCHSLSEIEGLETLELEQLTMKEHSCTIRLPDLSKLKVLNRPRLKGEYASILGAKRWLEELKSLESVDIDCCNSLRKLSNFSYLARLKHLSLNVCRITELNCLGLVTLEKLELYVCCQDRFPLQSLSILGCISLKEFTYMSPSLRHPSVNLFSTLTTFKCHRLVSLEILDLSQCDLHENTLKVLEVRESENLKEIRGLEELISLEVLDLSNCPSLEKLSDLSNLSNLKALYAMKCKVLRVDGLNYLVSLQFLHVSGMRITYKTLDFSLFRYLKEVIISYPYVLAEIKGLEELISLEKLWIYDCFCLEKLSDLSNLTNLRDFKLHNCSSFSLLNTKGFKHLVYLEISSLFKMENIIIDFSRSTNLMELNLSGLTHLTKITGLDESKSLQVLNVSMCRSLKELPDLSRIASFRQLNINGCVNLPQIKGLSSSVLIMNNY